MTCSHKSGFDWTDAVLDRRNGGWEVTCLSCRKRVTVRRLATPESIRRQTEMRGPKVHMSKKERLAERRKINDKA